MNITHFQLDLNTNYWTAAECIVETKEYATDLAEALEENLTPLEKSVHKKPYILYRCKKIPLRKS
jgi:hypothetical protein